MSGQRKSNATTAAPTAVRLLWALAACEELAQVRGAAEVEWALAWAARAYGVPQARLAHAWLRKVIECSRARQALAAMAAYDQTEQGKP